MSKLTLNSSPETREGCRSAGNLCWLGTRVHPARQKQPPAEQTRSGEITWRRRKKKTTHACNIMTDGWIMKRRSNEKKVRRREQAGRNRADGNQTESDSTETTWLPNERVFSCTPPPLIPSPHRRTCVFVSYIFVVVKTDVRTFAVSGVLRQLARIRTFSWRRSLRKKWDSRSNSALETTTCRLLSPLPIKA